MASAKKDELLTITQISKRSGVASSALRFYEERGLIYSARTAAGHRRYPRAILRRVAFIVFAQKLGLSLDEVAVELAGLPVDSAPTGKDWSRISQKWTRRVDEQIAELKKLRKGLGACIGWGCLSVAACRFVNPNDRVSGFGAGPRFWLGDRPRQKPKS